MGVWKKIGKINQKRHQERHQPNRRSHLGLLEKHKDYVKRAKDYQKKEKILKKLKEKALNKNPNEYYHHMVNSQVHNGIHTENVKPRSEHTIEQKLLLEKRNLAYVDMKLNIEHKKLEKLKSRLHLIDLANRKTKDVPKLNGNSFILNALEEKTLIKLHTIKEKKYNELIKRIERRKKLAIIKEKMEVEKNLKNTKRISRPKLISEGTKTKPAVYEWKYERKK